MSGQISQIIQAILESFFEKVLEPLLQKYIWNLRHNTKSTLKDTAKVSAIGIGATAGFIATIPFILVCLFILNLAFISAPRTFTACVYDMSYLYITIFTIRKWLLVRDRTIFTIVPIGGFFGLTMMAASDAKLRELPSILLFISLYFFINLILIPIYRKKHRRNS